MLTSDAIYDELQYLDYLVEFTPAQQRRYNYLENILPDVLEDERGALMMLGSDA